MQVANKSPIVMSSRGARFLDLVRQNKLNVSPQLTIKANRRFSLNDALKKTQESEKKQEYFNFSSEVKFNPAASPSSGILSKRKSEAESPLTNSSAKRKRVGFLDPVSSTKEYLISAEEEKHKSNSNLIRCLVYNEDDFGDDEEEEMTTTNKDILPSSDDLKDDQEKELEIKEELESPDEESENTGKADTSTTGTEPQVNPLSFKDNTELLDYVKRTFTVEEVIGVYADDITHRKDVVKKVSQQIDLNELVDEYFPVFNDENLSNEQSKIVFSIIDNLSKLMKRNLRVKHKILDILSEKHSDDFLDHALQENSISHVCDKISIPKIVNFLIHRANASANDEYDNLFEQMNRKILYHLLESTSNRDIVQERQEMHVLLNLLFKNKKKIDIFDISHEYLRNLV